jgi:nuclear RNA export factor
VSRTGRSFKTSRVCILFQGHTVIFSIKLIVSFWSSLASPQTVQLLMFSSPTPAPGSRTIANNALRSAGLLVDRDTTMRDVTDKPGGKKPTSRIKPNLHRTRASDLSNKKDLLGSGPRPVSIYVFQLHPLDWWLTNTQTLFQGSCRVSTSHAGPSDPLVIRGSARPTIAGRIRRNAVSATSRSNSPSLRPPTRVKVADQWREVVKLRYNPDSRFLNLEVSAVNLNS